MFKPHIVVLGGGPAGVGAAYKLAQSGKAQVTLIEQNSTVGGNAGSFELDGLYADYGSHRLHPACDKPILNDLANLLGDDLLNRPRNGRIRLSNRWVHFPLKPLDLILNLPANFKLGVIGDMLKKTFDSPHPRNSDENFASVMERNLGKTICRDFYFPFSRKLWGLEPGELSPIQAKRRVRANSFSRIILKVIESIPGLGIPGSGHFYYPRKGFGQISEAFASGAQELGAQFLFNTAVERISLVNASGLSLTLRSKGKAWEMTADRIWSTIPVTALTRMLYPVAPADIQAAAKHLEFRAMILVYLVLETDRFSEYDAHYFPEASIPITRLSEPKVYSNAEQPAGLTVLCAELPCQPEEIYWSMKDEELGALVQESLTRAGLSIRANLRRVFTRRLRHAYPIYRRGFEADFQAVYAWLEQIPNLLTFGRQGLYAHDNTHHALFMAYCAVDCLSQGNHFDSYKWVAYQKVFDTHVVED